MDCSTPGLPVHHQLSEFTQTHVLRVGDTIQPSHPLLSFHSHLQSFPASGSFQMSQFFASGGQSIGVTAAASVLPMNIQNCFPLEWTGRISLLTKGLSMITLYAKQKKRHRCTEQTFGLLEKARVGCFKRTGLKHAYYLG